MKLTLHPLVTAEQFEAVCQAAYEDGYHNTIQPTHFAAKDNRIVGAVSIGSTVWWWLDSRLTPHDSKTMWIAVETLLRDRGLTRYVVLLPPTSPYNRVVDAMGFRKIEDTQVFVRDL